MLLIRIVNKDGTVLTWEFPGEKVSSVYVDYKKSAQADKAGATDDSRTPLFIASKRSQKHDYCHRAGQGDIRDNEEDRDISVQDLPERVSRNDGFPRQRVRKAAAHGNQQV